MDTLEIWHNLNQAHPAAARLAILSSVPVRVSPSFLRLARLLLVADGSTGDEADLWLSDLVEARSSAGFSYRPWVRNFLREQLASDPDLLNRVWLEIHVPQSRWLSPRMRLEEELTWHLLRDPADPWIEDCWQEIWHELHEDPNAEGIARWLVRAIPNLPDSALENDWANRVRIAAYLLLGDASILGDEPQRFISTGEFNFALKRLPRRSIQVGLTKRGILVSTIRQIENGHLVDLPATRPLWLQLEISNGSAFRVFNLGDDDVDEVEFAEKEVRLRLIDGVVHRLVLEDAASGRGKKPDRAPKVQIEYDVEVGEAIRRVELPWVSLIMGEFSGANASELSELARRGIEEVSSENFDRFLESQKPRVQFSVDNVLGDEGQMAVDITFTSLDDFSPDGIARHVGSEIEEIEITEVWDGSGKIYRINQGGPIAQSLGKEVAFLDTLSLDYVASKLGERPADLVVNLIPDKISEKWTLQVMRKGHWGKLLSARNQLKDFLITINGNEFAQKTLATILGNRNLMRKVVGKESSNMGEIASHETLLRVVDALEPKNEKSRIEIEGKIATLFEHILKNYDSISQESPEVSGKIERVIADIDKRLTAQMNLILHHPDLQKLEGSWRGLYYLICNTETSDQLKIKVLNVSKGEIYEQIKGQSTEWDQTILFKIIYEENFGTPGGQPYGVIVGDYEFSSNGQDMEILRTMSKICAAAHAPFISAASPELLQMDSWEELPNPRDLRSIFSSETHGEWESLRKEEEARYIGLTMPRFLSRHPYGTETEPVESFDFEEDTDGIDRRKYTWSNAAYAMGANIHRSFYLYGWTTQIRGLEGGGIVENLPVHTFLTDDGGIDVRCPTEVAISDRREKELCDIGLIPLCHYKNSSYSCFFGVQSLKKSAKYLDEDAQANENLFCRLPYVFPACRFAHYLKCMVRDRIGSFMEAEDIQNWLNMWLMSYVFRGGGDNAIKAKKPLADAAVEVMPIEGEPGNYNMVFHLQPHFQLEGLTAPLRLVSKFKIPIQLA